LILLDTNVVSETMRRVPDPRVIEWLDAQSADGVYISTVSLAELLLGVAVLPDGRRKSELAYLLMERLAVIIGARVLSFDAQSAKAYALIVARARAAGKSISLADGFIASIAFANDLTVATRDVSPFEAAGVSVINPWL
jgi:predicted nucleic acid-binding protein